ncbi:MAG TPA: hypothetical protein VG518_03670 [Solirubrobacterales bacterium]|nr:hypothetical protein [Solirubrobacterales bacterium]
MAKSDRHRWWDWRISDTSGQSIRADDNRGQERQKIPKGKRRAGNGWWWTLSAREAECKGCGKHLMAQEKIAYNHQSRKIFCPDCAQAECISEMCKPSRKLLRVGS